MGSAFRIVAAVSLVAALAWAGVAATNIARADALIRDASTEMGTWVATRSQPALGTWVVVNERLQAALAIVPGDPTAHELLGLLKSSRGDSPDEQSEGIARFHQALSLRPVSPYTWANLAEAQYRRGEPERNLELAFERAAQLGAAEPGVQWLVADYGLAVWGEVTPATQEIIDRLVGAGFNRNPLEMLQISERRGRLDVACRHVSAAGRTPDQKWTKFCQVSEATP